MPTNNIYKYLNEISEISEEAYDKLMEVAYVIDYAKKKHIYQSDSQNSKLYFVLSGIVRTYVVDDKDVEVNKSIETKEKIFMINPEVEAYEVKAQCLIASEILEIDVDSLLELSQSYPELIKLYNKVFEKIYADIESRTLTLLSTSATDRYLSMIGEFPRIENQISQYHIASYIGVTPIQLSRIRRKLNSPTKVVV